MQSQTALIVFAREPKLGKAKTRLAKSVGQEAALKFYEAFVNDVLKACKNYPVNKRFLFYAGSAQSLSFLNSFSQDFQLKRQFGKTLGDRMYYAARYCFQQRFQKVIIIGTDCLTISTQDIARAKKFLDNVPCVFGPSTDGGYYLIGLTRADQRIFANVSWGTDSVLKKSVANLNKLGWHHQTLNIREDIDTVFDLRKFDKSKKDAKIAPNTRRLLARITI